MKKGILLIVVIFLIVIGHTSCVHEIDYGCTPGLRFFTIKVNGDSLDDHYTIRVSTNQKLRSFYVFDDKEYWVLDDHMREELLGKKETFIFKGIINKQVVVNETYIFRGSECHVEKIYGKSEVDL